MTTRDSKAIFIVAIVAGMGAWFLVWLGSAVVDEIQSIDTQEIGRDIGRFMKSIEEGRNE